MISRPLLLGATVLFCHVAFGQTTQREPELTFSTSSAFLEWWAQNSYRAVARKIGSGNIFLEREAQEEIKRTSSQLSGKAFEWSFRVLEIQESKVVLESDVLRAPTAAIFLRWLPEDAVELKKWRAGVPDEIDRSGRQLIIQIGRGVPLERVHRLVRGERLRIPLTIDEAFAVVPSATVNGANVDGVTLPVCELHVFATAQPIKETEQTSFHFSREQLEQLAAVEQQVRDEVEAKRRANSTWLDMLIDLPVGFGHGVVRLAASVDAVVEIFGGDLADDDAISYKLGWGPRTLVGDAVSLLTLVCLPLSPILIGWIASRRAGRRARVSQAAA